MIGIEISKSTNVGIEDLWITNCKIGIGIHDSRDSIIKGDDISFGRYGILLHSSTDNTLTNNTTNSNSRGGIKIWSSSNNNTLTNNTTNSNNNTIILDLFILFLN